MKTYRVTYIATQEIDAEDEEEAASVFLEMWHLGDLTPVRDDLEIDIQKGE